jgi:hypothetical protein
MTPKLTVHSPAKKTVLTPKPSIHAPLMKAWPTLKPSAHRPHPKPASIRSSSLPSQLTSTKMPLRMLVVRVLAAVVFLVFAAVPNHLASGSAMAFAQESIPAAEVVWQHVGRVYLNPDTGKAIWAGYVVHLNGINSPLFNGAPSESTAYFTFSTDILQLTPMPNNGDMALSLVSAGTFSIYYNARPNGDWSDPATFSSGRLIATFSRKESLFPEIGPIGFHALSERLLSSQSFAFDDKTLNFNRIVPNGITFSQFFSTTPLTGIKDYPIALAGTGSTIAVGGPLSALPIQRGSSLPAIQMNRFDRQPDPFAIGNQPTYRTIFRSR